MTSFFKSHYRLLIFLLLWNVALLSRLALADQITFPGHGDRAFYFNVAQNLASGRGLQIDYIWHYLPPPESITHASTEYWMPLGSILMSIPMTVLGTTLYASVLPTIIFGLGLAFPTYLFGKLYTGSSTVAIFAAGLVLLLPDLFKYSLLTESAIFFAFFAAFSLLLMIMGTTSPKYYLLAALSAGLAQMSRNDGILLVPILVVAILIAPQTRAIRMRYLGLGLLVYLATMIPLFVHNWQTLGTLLPSGPAQTMFLTRYEDLYVYSKSLSLETYQDWGISNIVGSKWKAAGTNLEMVGLAFGGLGLSLLIWFFAAASVIESRITMREQRDWRTYSIPGMFLASLFVFHVVFVTFPGSVGSFHRSAMALLPFVLVLALDTMCRHVSSKPVALLVVLAIGIAFFAGGVGRTQTIFRFNTRLGQQLSLLNNVLDQQVELFDKDVVIMTRDPWEVHLATGYKAIQIPNEDLDTIHEVAQRYKANYLLLPGSRSALDGIYRGTASDVRFELVTNVPDTRWKVYQIN